MALPFLFPRCFSLQQNVYNKALFRLQGLFVSFSAHKVLRLD